MPALHTATPATAICGKPAPNVDRFAGEIDNHNNPVLIDIQAGPAKAPICAHLAGRDRRRFPALWGVGPMTIRCELTGSNTAQVGGFTARGATDLCRLLLAAGVDADAPLECHRGGTLALRVKSIRAGAGLTVRETDGPRFVAWKAWPDRAVTPPIRQNEQGGAI
jgi:hypothetical protein